MFKRIAISRLFAVVASYVAGSYAYAIIFSLRMGGGDKFLLVIAPAWFAAHISLVLACTLVGAGRDGWDMDNTVSFVGFVAAFAAVYYPLRIRRHRFQDRPNNSPETMPSSGKGH